MGKREGPKSEIFHVGVPEEESPAKESKEEEPFRREAGRVVWGRGGKLFQDRGAGCVHPAEKLVR
jgi:hypothetical protein